MKTKNIIITLGLVLTSLSMNSCSDWLDPQPEGTPNAKNFWKTDKDFSDAIDAVYANLSMEETWGRDLFWEQGASDDIFYSRKRGATQMNLANLTMNGSTESNLKDIYQALYQMNSRANRVVLNALKLSSPSDRIKMHLGEAYFMRAFSHFMIAYRYGRPDNGVPFDKYEDYKEYVDGKIPQQRKSVVENYELIIQDLDKAISMLPAFDQTAPADYGRATKDAAIALKVKVYAYWAQYDSKKWSEIPALVDKLENECHRALLPKFADVFSTEHEWSKEYIFSVNSDAKNYAGSILPGIMLDNKGWGRYNGWGNFKPTLELWAEYSDKDQRRATTILQYGDEFTFFGEKRKFFSSTDLECGFHFNKYMEPFKYGTINNKGAGISDKVSNNGNRPTTDLNVPIMRFAEMLLFKAEALIETGKGAEAAKVLNRITTRAGLGDVYTNATMHDLMHERRCELAGEFTDRVHDLKRWSVKYPEARERLEAAKHGIKYVNRSNPNSEIDTVNGKAMLINGKTYKGVIEIMPAKKYDAEKACVFPYSPEEIKRSMGALKQNKGY
ncbi:RagB/SusD family nutrient uptake outer membrane protein [Porphyromonas pogonae]|uniref:RagB/SusD family nutrient uptake outer membrane protein n=1 Tax=Porphyromonas pogonae TaxID=867595 RepID=UPI002E772BA4|nr:RagB/SusD family nutrient uptake outer membrane protein [Porphyromonas pogonae]